MKYEVISKIQLKHLSYKFRLFPLSSFEKEYAVLSSAGDPDPRIRMFLGLPDPDPDH
jgi:hypothetical protein